MNSDYESGYKAGHAAGVAATGTPKSQKGMRTSSWLKEYQLLLMEDLSEYQWCAGWIDNLEVMMWDGSMKDNPASIRVREIAAITGVWFVWDDDAPYWIREVPIDEWIRERALDRG